MLFRSQTTLSTDPSNPNEYGYDVKIGSKVFGFYCPYEVQMVIETEGREFTLATSKPDHAYNWVVCEELPRNRKRRFEEIDRDVHVHVDEFDVKVRLKKVGVLRTDSCSELLVGKRDGGSMLKKINCLFV